MSGLQKKHCLKMPFMYLQTSHMAEKSNAINTRRISLNFIIYIYNISDVRKKKNISHSDPARLLNKFDVNKCFGQTSITQNSKLSKVTYLKNKNVGSDYVDVVITLTVFVEESYFCWY